MSNHGNVTLIVAGIYRPSIDPAREMEDQSNDGPYPLVI